MTPSPPRPTARSPVPATAWVPGFVPPPPGNSAPAAPTLNAPANAATGIGTSPTLDVGLSDPDSDPLTVTYFGRPFASGIFTQIAQHTAIASGTSDSAIWSSLADGQKFEWYVTVSDGSLTTTGPTWTFSTSPGTDPVFVGAGDIADCGRPQDEATAAVIGAIEGTIWTAGDNVYPTGTAANFTNCYEPSWGGAIKARTRPVPGNHDWGTGVLDSLTGYFGYYGASANAGGTSYYSYDIAGSNWHVVNLDSECQLVPGGCADESPQEDWLELDLAANSGENVIAIWHKPRYSSGVTNYEAMQPLYDDLYARGRRPPALGPRPHLRAVRADQVRRHARESARRRPDLRHPPVHGRYRRCRCADLRRRHSTQARCCNNTLRRPEADPPRHHLRLEVPADRRQHLHRFGHRISACRTPGSQLGAGGCRRHVHDAGRHRTQYRRAGRSRATTAMPTWTR